MLCRYFKQSGLAELQGIQKLGRTVKSVAKGINEKRREKGLLPRAVCNSGSELATHHYKHQITSDIFVGS